MTELPGGTGTMLEVLRQEQGTYEQAAQGKFSDKAEDLAPIIDMLEQGLIGREDILEFLHIQLRRRLGREERETIRQELPVHPLSEDLEEIASWAHRGTVTQFANQIAAKIAGRGYEVEREGNTLIFYRITQTGGFLGRGAIESRDPVMRVSHEGDDVTIAEDPLDEEFVRMVARDLRRE